MEDVTMYEAMRDMLNWLLQAVLTFCNSAPGAYFWALVLVFFVVGLFFKIFWALVLFFYERRL